MLQALRVMLKKKTSYRYVVKHCMGLSAVFDYLFHLVKNSLKKNNVKNILLIDQFGITDSLTRLFLHCRATAGKPVKQPRKATSLDLASESCGTIGQLIVFWYFETTNIMFT